MRVYFFIVFFLNLMDLRERTKEFALTIIKAYGLLPKITEAQVIGKQCLRSGTSIGAHYREAIRARSNAEYISKLETALQELEETDYWLDLLASIHLLPELEVKGIKSEIHELISIFVSCVKTARFKNKTLKNE